MSRRSSPRSMRELLSLCHRRQHRPCEGRRLQQRRRPFRPSPPGEDDRLHGPLPADWRHAGPAYAQSRLRGDGPQRPRFPGRYSIRNSTLFPTTPMYAWARRSSCRFMGRRSTIPRWRTRSAGSSSTTRIAIEIISAARDDAAFRRACLRSAIASRGVAALPAHEAEVALFRPSRDA